jgi:hypothetical protein
MAAKKKTPSGGKAAAIEQFEVVAPRGITVPSGEIRLTKAQSVDRLASLEAVKGKKDVYDIQKPLFFKCGEQIGLPAGQNKALAQALEPVGKNESKEPAEAQDTTDEAAPAEEPPAEPAEQDSTAEDDTTGDDIIPPA